jgi:hypothetical protein
MVARIMNAASFPNGPAAAGVTCGAEVGGEISCCCGNLNDPKYSPYADPCSSENLVTAPADVNLAPIPSDNPDACLSSYPDNVASDALACYATPGANFTDDMGQKISCPTASVQGPSGGQISPYTVCQIAQMISGQATPTVETQINVAGTSIPYTPPVVSIPTVQPTQAQIQAVAPGTTSAGSSSPAASTAGSNTSTNSTSSTNSDVLTDDSLISGVPNWAVGLGAVAALLLVMNMGGHR